MTPSQHAKVLEALEHAFEKTCDGWWTKEDFLRLSEAISIMRSEGVGDDAKDLARYRWLRAQIWNDNKLAVILRPVDNTRLGCFLPFGSLLDSTIDRYMSAPSTEPEVKP